MTGLEHDLAFVAGWVAGLGTAWAVRNWRQFDARIISPRPVPGPSLTRPHVYLVAGDRPYDWAKVSRAGLPEFIGSAKGDLGSGERRGSAAVGKVSRPAPEGRSAS